MSFLLDSKPLIPGWLAGFCSTCHQNRLVGGARPDHQLPLQWLNPGLHQQQVVCPALRHQWQLRPARIVARLPTAGQLHSANGAAADQVAPLAIVAVATEGVRQRHLWLQDRLHLGRHHAQQHDVWAGLSARGRDLHGGLLAQLHVDGGLGQKKAIRHLQQHLLRHRLLRLCFLWDTVHAHKVSRDSAVCET